MGQLFTFFKKGKSIIHNQEFKLKFSDSVGVDWKTLGRWLNIEENYLDIIDQDNYDTHAKAYKMLTKWMQISDNPTLEDLKTALSNMRRNDLIREVDKLTKSSNSIIKFLLLSILVLVISLIFSNFNFSILLRNSKSDSSRLSAELKKYYLKYYWKINEHQPLIKASVDVDLNQKFVDLCIVDAVNAQVERSKDAVLNVERKKFLEKQMRYTPIQYSEIFTKEKSVLLISGIAGIGKTWLLRKCLLDWSNGLIWKKY
ncbi:uncharacterized protein LOC105849729 isoform X1 [Hydra vulgaris]|uniref:uncharacterized protein LOC105849729 isoform X1 n=1 Tax=Hydra vulgaris TaxID=6087 RepID=UPI001F5E68FC|nr:uncharacterized protein LOC105849729 [Hydra vulgaris]